jgi:hypothetical protein
MEVMLCPIQTVWHWQAIWYPWISVSSNQKWEDYTCLKRLPSDKVMPRRVLWKLARLSAWKGYLLGNPSRSSMRPGTWSSPSLCCFLLCPVSHRYKDFIKWVLIVASSSHELESLWRELFIWKWLKGYGSQTCSLTPVLAAITWLFFPRCRKSP